MSVFIVFHAQYICLLYDIAGHCFCVLIFLIYFVVLQSHQGESTIVRFRFTMTVNEIKRGLTVTKWEQNNIKIIIVHTQHI